MREVGRQRRRSRNRAQAQKWGLLVPENQPMAGACTVTKAPRVRQRSLFAESQVDAGREDQVVRFCVGDGWVGFVAVADGDLPSEPFVDFGYGVGVERDAVLAEILEIGIDGRGLVERGKRAELVHEDFAKGEPGGI